MRKRKKQISQNISKEINFDLDGIKIINPLTSNITNELIDKFYELRKSKGL